MAVDVESARVPPAAEDPDPAADPVTRRPEVVRWPDRRNRGVWLALLVPVGLALWLTAPAWGGRPAGGDDVMGHLVRADFGIHHLVLHLRLDGWFPRFMAGHQEFLLYGPGFDWLLAAIRAVTFGALSDSGALKVASIGSTVALGPATAYLARSFGLSKRAAVLAAVLAFAVNNPFGVGLQATFVIGLVPEQVAAPLFCLALGAGWRLVEGSGARWDRRVAVIAMTALVLTHPITVMETVFILGMAIVWRTLNLRLSIGGIGRLATAAAVTAGLSAFWLIPYAVHWNLRGPVATWDTPSLHRRIADILAGHILFAPDVAVFVIVAGLIVAFVALAGHKPPVVLVVLPIAFLVLADYAHRHSFPTGDVGLLLENRGLGYAGLLCMLLLAFVIDGATDTVWQQAGSWPSELRGIWAAGGDLVAVGAALALVLYPIHATRVAREQPIAITAMFEAAQELHVTVPETARFAVERDYPSEIGRTGVTQPNLWLAEESGRNELNVFNGESTASGGAGYVPDDIHNGDPSEVADELLRLGVTEVVTVNQATFSRLAASSRYDAIWQDGPLGILGLQPTSEVHDPGTLLSSVAGDLTGSTSTSSDPDRPAWTVETAQTAPVVVAVGWSPKWHASVDGRAVPIARVGQFHLVGVTIPAGHHTLALVYRPDTWDHLGELVTVLTLVGLVAMAVRRRRRGGARGRAPTDPVTGPESPSSASSTAAPASPAAPGPVTADPAAAGPVTGTQAGGPAPSDGAPPFPTPGPA